VKAIGAAVPGFARDAVDLWSGVVTYDHAFVDPDAIRAAILTEPMQSVPAGDQVFHGIRMLPADVLLALRAALAVVAPTATIRLPFARSSPAGQIEPNDVHSDHEMGDLTAIVYLNPDPAPGDGTVFWRRKATGQARGVWDADCQIDSHDRDAWDRWRMVDAKYNRLLLFRSDYYHSRSLVLNYGQGDDARLIVVAFLSDPEAA